MTMNDISASYIFFCILQFFVLLFITAEPKYNRVRSMLLILSQSTLMTSSGKLGQGNDYESW